MKIERRPRNVGRRLNGGQCSIFCELMCSFCSPSPQHSCYVAIWWRRRRLSRGLQSRLAPSVCVCRWSDSLLMCPLGRRRRKIADCVGGQAGAVVRSLALGCRNRFRPGPHSEPLACFSCKQTLRLLDACSVPCRPERAEGGHWRIA